MLFVTGLTGHTGKWFCKRLVNENYKGKIRYITKTDTPLSIKGNQLNIEKVVGSLADFDFMVKATEGAKTVLHIASIKLTNNVVEAAIKNNVEWIICVHTTGRFSKYKSASEEYIRIEDGILKRRGEIDITIVRPTMIYGSYQDRNMIKLVAYLHRNKIFPMFGGGENLMQPVHARDLGNAYYDILMNREVTVNKEYNLAGKESLPYIDVVRETAKALGKNATIIKFPIWLSVLGAKIYGTISKNPMISVEQVLRMQEDKAFSCEQAARDFGYNPISFQEGIKEEVAEYLSLL